jgi:ribosomal-protein-alanine N-acetyltransferase
MTGAHHPGPATQARWDFEVRPARRADLAQVHRVEEACYSTPWSARAFRTLLERDYVLFRVIVATAADTASATATVLPDGLHASPAAPLPAPVIAGFGVLWWGGEEAELANLSVHPEWQGRGGGARLLDTLLAEGQCRGVERVFLEVRESNHPARGLYDSRGFVPVGRRSRYYEKPVEDALVLCLDLTSPDC